MSLDWDKILKDVSGTIELLAPAVEVIFPETAVAAEIVKKIIAGVQAMEPSATALYKQIINGEDVTPDQLKAYIADNEEANQELHDEIMRQIAENA